MCHTYSDFCHRGGRICGYLDSIGGYCTCDLSFYPLVRDKERNTLKPEACKNLKEAE